MRFASPHESVDEDEDNYIRRQYYGLVPIDGFTYSHKLNSVSKRFLMKLLNDHRYNTTLLRNQQADKLIQDNDADFREIVREIAHTETVGQKIRRLEQEEKEGIKREEAERIKILADLEKT